MQFSKKRARKAIAFTSIGIYVFSLTQDCIFTGNDGSYASWFTLVFGWFSISFGNLMILSWLANPLIFLSWILTFINSPKLAWLISAIATVFCILFLCFDEIMVNEAGGFSDITAYGAGYYLWLGSAAIVMFGNLYLIIKENDEIPNRTKLNDLSSNNWG